MQKQIRYLALGDSYTIGELVPIHDSFPYQLVQVLRKNYGNNYFFHAPEIIAKTGWTTDELLERVAGTHFLPQYDVVTLLIGVNNQYRGRTVENFREEFSILLKKAIDFAGNNPKQVFVISIPDWGVTPFAEGRETIKIAQEIDAFNDACKELTTSMGSDFINITESLRKDGGKEEYLASDKLHPSGKEYAKWANALALLISGTL